VEHWSIGALVEHWSVGGALERWWSIRSAGGAAERWGVVWVRFRWAGYLPRFPHRFPYWFAHRLLTDNSDGLYWLLSRYLDGSQTRLEASVISKNNWAKFGGRRCPGNPSFLQIRKANLSGYLPKKEMAIFFLTLNSGLAPNKGKLHRYLRYWHPPPARALALACGLALSVTLARAIDQSEH